MNTGSTNFGAAAQDYAKFRAGFPDSLFERLAALGIGQPGQRIVDLGTGTGTLARGFALRGASVTGIDPDPRMLTAARGLDREAGVQIEYREGRAEGIPLDDGVADVVSAGQCWHWFDGPLAAREMARVSRPVACAVIAHFDWLPVAGSIVEATEQLIMRHNPAWHMNGGNGFHPESIPALRAAGYTGFEVFSWEYDVPYSAQAWRGRIRASAGVAATLTPEQVAVFDAELAQVLAAACPSGHFGAPHRVFALIAQRAP